MQEVQGMDSKVYGYIRVSTREQNIERQMISLLDAGVNQKDIYIDKQSGKNFQRPAYKKMMRRVREGDLVIVKSIDRLGRNYQEIMEQWRIITKEKKADICIQDILYWTQPRQRICLAPSLVMLSCNYFLLWQKMSVIISARDKPRELLLRKQEASDLGNQRFLYPIIFQNYICGGRPMIYRLQNLQAFAIWDVAQCIKGLGSTGSVFAKEMSSKYRIL